MTEHTLYVMPSYLAYVHSEEVSAHSPTMSYVADLRTGSISILEGAASIMWGVFEQPLSMNTAVDYIAEIVEVERDEIRSTLEDFLPQLLEQGFLERVDPSR